MGKIVYIMGKSSSGKDTIFQKLKEALPEFKTIVLYTTRPIRAGEQDGVEYHFVKEETLKAFEEKGQIIELRAYNTVHGVWKYFTADDGQINLEKENYLVIGTLESYEQMKKYFGEDALLPIYVQVEDGIRLGRALERERRQQVPKYEELCRRFLADSQDFSEGNIARAGIETRFENVELESCVSEILRFVKERVI
ncbi:guanylate kinase [Mediterraneibacter butyricigenes]|uniref:Guanylate kinase n=1 Tax=Mediterraneibacter butyricigenes TaxID=2316025 RepID=A0A391P4W6_9FIRM|nr:guanylate kinase [Mediterraneibacter butyricigenes]RGO26210.1 guanylate kinase [Dorea sp. OM02-2LB]GCA67226.1 guanylate kinase [Mediterraneibacter butyricigenes]